MRRNSRACTALTLLLALPVQAETLRLLNWEDYLAPRVIERWEAETGIGIEQIYFDGDERRDQILVDAERHDIDLAMVDEVASRLFGERGLLAAPTPEQVPNLRHVDPAFQRQCSQYSVPYAWGTMGIAYRSDKLPTAPHSWSELIRPAPSLRGHIGMMDDGTDLLAPVLFMQGKSINTEDRASLEQAFEVLKAQVPAVLTYEYAITFLKSNPRADDLHMALVYSGDQQVLNEVAGTEAWRYVIPDEGTILWADCLALVRNSAHREAAIRFIDFLNRPEIAALNAEQLWVATPNLAALPLLSPAFRQDQAVFPPPQRRARSQYYAMMSNAGVVMRTRISSAIKRLYDAQ